MTGGRHAAPDDQPARPVIAVERVGFARAGRTILDEVSVSIRAGESVAVVGPSGSGKSSLLALLARLERADRGRVERDASFTFRDGLVLQAYGLVGVLTAQENVEAPLQVGVGGRLSRDDVRTRAIDALAAVGLSDVADHLVEELSGGQQQRVAIARALVVAPTLFLGDEITAELDHAMGDAVLDRVLDIARNGGAVVLATHDPEVAARCTRSIRLVDGRVATAS